MEENDKICNFKKYAKQTLDLMVDSYKWKYMADYCDDPEMRTKYHGISDELKELFMKEHNHIGELFKY